MHAILTSDSDCLLCDPRTLYTLAVEQILQIRQHELDALFTGPECNARSMFRKIEDFATDIRF